MSSTRYLVPEDRRRNGEAAMASLVRAAIVAARSVTDRSAHRSGWPDDRNVEMILRAAVSQTTMADAAAYQSIAVAFVASLIKISASANVIARSLRLSFGGAAQITVPSLSLPAAQWIGEGGPIPVSQGTTSPGAVVTPHKIAVLVSLTNEMIRGSNAEQLVRQVLIENVGATLDVAMFSTAAEVVGLRPAGILNGVGAITSAGGMIKDIALIAEALAPVAGGNGAVLVASPAQAVSLTLGAAREYWPVLTSAALPAGTVIGLVPSGIATVIETPRIEASSDAVFNRADPASQAVDIGGVLATPLISSFQTDSVSEKFILPATWSRRSASAVAWVQGVTW